MSAEKGWIGEPQAPRGERHRSYAAYRYEQIAAAERERIRLAELPALEECRRRSAEKAAQRQEEDS